MTFGDKLDKLQLAGGHLRPPEAAWRRIKQQPAPPAGPIDHRRPQIARLGLTIGGAVSAH